MPFSTEDRATSGPPVSTLRAGVWLALAAWLLDLGIGTFRKFALHEVRVWNVQSVALGPIAYLLAFGVLAGALELVLRGGRGGRKWRISLMVLIGTAAFCVLLAIPKVHKAAWLLLATGIGIRLGSWLDGRPALQSRLVRGTMPALATIVVLTAASAAVWAPIRERLGLARLGAAVGSRPNVLVLILDTVRASSLSLYGYGRPTSPALEAFAGRAVKFDWAFSTASWTVPSHVSMFSGVYPSNMTTPLHSDWDHPLDSSQPFLPEVLRDHGYATAAFVANLAFTTTEFGLDRGFLLYRDFPFSLGQLLLSTAPGRIVATNGRWRNWLDYKQILVRKSAREINAEFLGWLAARKSRPFFAFLNYFDAHGPYLPPEPFASKFATGRPSVGYRFLPHFNNLLATEHLGAEEYRANQGRYDGAIAYLDDQLGRLFGELDRRGILDSTLVIVTSDHGEEFGEHDRLGHTRDVYLPLIHVPLLISYPASVPEGISVPETVTNADLAATVLDLVGLGEAVAIPGSSLRRHWRKGAVASSAVIVAEANPGEAKRSVVAGRYHYIRNPKAPAQLFDFVADPAEQNDLAGQSEHRSLLEELGAALDSTLTSRGAVRGPVTPLDPEEP